MLIRITHRTKYFDPQNNLELTEVTASFARYLAGSLNGLESNNLHHMRVDLIIVRRE